MRVKLHVPSIKEMEYRQKFLAQPETMSYNAGQALDAEGYDVATGCIDFPITDWRYWRDVWLWREPSRYSAYVMDEETGEFVGEACYFYDMEADAHSVGVLIEYRHRNKGYGAEAVRLIAERAFRQEEVDSLFMDLPLGREDAVRMALTAGFREEFVEDGVCRSMEQIGQELGITRERVRQIERQAMDKLQQLGASMGLEDFLE